MEIEISLSHEQQPHTLNCPEPDNSCHKQSRYFKNHFNIIIPQKICINFIVLFYKFCFLFCVSCYLYFSSLYIAVLVLCTSV
jgi:hypothetical protein